MRAVESRPALLYLSQDPSGWDVASAVVSLPIVGTKPGAARKIWVTILGLSESGTSPEQIRAAASETPASAKLSACEERTLFPMILVSEFKVIIVTTMNNESTSNTRWISCPSGASQATPRWERAMSSRESQTAIERAWGRRPSSTPTR